jgi:hypothetical protein
LLLVGVYVFAVETLDSRAGERHWLVMWPVVLTRVVICFLLLFTRDEECSFEDLELEGAGFGLVVDARDLRRELRKILAGKESRGHVKRYKATMLRMCETMSVSYRWHDQPLDVGDLGPINMKPWHLEALIKAIDCSRCLYVWVDACGVPQKDCALKRVLLSRMMSVYASSFVTVALLSRELSTDRYHEVLVFRIPSESSFLLKVLLRPCHADLAHHLNRRYPVLCLLQRVWTMQEYCSSPQLLVIKEEGVEEVDGFQAKAAHEDEVQVVEQLRREHLARQASCMPLWLGGLSKVLGEMDKSQAHHIWKTYQRLCRILYCTYRADTIRAL